MIKGTSRTRKSCLDKSYIVLNVPLIILRQEIKIFKTNPYNLCNHKTSAYPSVRIRRCLEVNYSCVCAWDWASPSVSATGAAGFCGPRFNTWFSTLCTCWYLMPISFANLPRSTLLASSPHR